MGFDFLMHFRGHFLLPTYKSAVIPYKKFIKNERFLHLVPVGNLHVNSVVSSKMDYIGETNNSKLR